MVGAETKGMKKLSRGEAKRFSKGRGSSSPQMEATIQKIVNDSRVSKGKDRMEHHKGLAKLARKHSMKLMLNYSKTGVPVINHSGFSGRFNTISLDYSLSKAGENVAYHSKYNGSAGSVVSSWAKSPSHYKNLYGKWNRTGVGVAIAPNGMIFATQLYGLKTDFTFD